MSDPEDEVEPNPPLPDGGPRDGTEPEEEASWPESKDG
ncbi:hypothetical protein BH11ACT2_BH11ACT2_23380 [soil metagenome]